MEEKMAKLSFSIAPSKPAPPKPTARPAAFSVPAAVDSGPAPQFVTTFDPPQTLAPPAAPAAAVIAPLPNSRRLSTVPTGGRPAFVPDDSDSSSSSAGYGLAVRDTEDSKRRKRAAADDAAATLRRFKQDMAVLPDTQGAEEYEEVPVEGFGAALLAGYGWKEGNPIGRDKSKGDPKILERGRRSGTQGLGAGPSDKTDAATVRPAAVRRSIRDLRAACLGSVTAAPYNSRPAAVHHYNP